MIVLHGGYLPASSSSNPSGFFLWGEGDFVQRTPLVHPRSVDVGVLEAELRAEGVPLGPASAGALGRIRNGRLAISVPSWERRPVPSTPAIRDGGDYSVQGEPILRRFEIEALFLTPHQTIDVLLPLPELLRADPRSVMAGDDIDYWSEVARWTFDLLLRRRVAPTIDDRVPRWRPVLSDPHEKGRFERFASAMPPVSRTAVAADDEIPAASRRFLAASVLLRSFLEDVVDASARDLIRMVIPAERRRFGHGEESHLVASLTTLRDAKDSLPASSPADEPEILRRFREWSFALLEPLPEGALRLAMRLDPPDTTADISPLWTLRYHLESTDDPSLELSAEEIWSAADSTLRRFGRRFTNPQETLLARLGQVAPLSPPIRTSLDERHPAGAQLSLQEAHRFLVEEAPLLAEAGVHVLLPSGGRMARVGVQLRGSESGWKSGSAVTRFGLQTLVDFDWKVAIGETLLTPAEFEELASQKVPLVSVRGEWVLLDRESVERTLKLFDRRPAGRTTLGDFLRIAGGLEAESGSYRIESIEGDGWLGELLDAGAARQEIAAFQVPDGFIGTLRPYQERGVGWLRFLTSRGLGACLADDMGLGKTVQFLATLLSAREAGEPIRPALLICPTSVAENWVKEGSRFSPSLRIAIHHGPDRASGEAFASLVGNVDLLVTTYALAHRDRALLGEVAWEYVALDEAQNVKNPSAAQSRAVRSLKARRRAALTGTPVENRLSELKSIFDFLNPGLLGTDEEFRREFSLPIERQRDPVAAERLRRVTAPFLLRRAKTDEGVAPDLPAKIETKEFVGLTREQASLYRATTRALLQGIGNTSGRNRRTKVLLLLLRLKQICNHPVHFLGDGTRLDGRSGKLIRILEMLEETLAEKRPALIFTQFTEMGHLLVGNLRAHFGCEVLFLHGGVPRKARAEMVRRFQEDEDPPPIFVLSLKAGGSGLNLTRASHVFHYDRWWNPAVEDQATDRAFRIGQSRNVQVHKFVCHGTLEERIDKMIEDKKELAQNILGAGESWIADMSDSELSDLVALSKDAVERDGSGGGRS